MTAVDAAFAVVCPLAAVQPERGVAALLGNHQVAVFRTVDDVLYALDNRDPFTGQNVLSRGIVGSRGDAPTVASPLQKQVFDLRTGVCVTDPGTRVPVHEVRLRDGLIEVQLSRPSGT